MQSTAQSTLSFKRDTAPLKGSYSIDVRGDGALACGTLYRLAQVGATYRMVSESTCLRQWNEFVDSLGRLTHGRVAWVRADERRWPGYASPEIPLHYHALLRYQHVPAAEDVAGLWKAKAGDAKVELYDAGGGAVWYIAKTFPYEDSTFDMGGLEHFGRL